MKSPFNLLFLFICISQLSFANTNHFTYPTQSKTISKEFDVNSQATMEVKNSYGNVTVVLWDENKITYDVKITVGAKNDKLTQELLNNIDVSFKTLPNGINATTVYPKSMSGNREIEVNYTIKIPRNAQASIDQKYGNVNVNELNGSLNLTCAYGNFTLGKINNKENSFDLSYLSSGKADYINYATFNVRYSTISIEKINYLVAKGNYNTFKLNNVGTFNFNTNYTNISTTKVQKLEISGNYLTLNFDEVNISSIIKSNYSTVKQNITSQTEFIQYQGNYARVIIGNILKSNFNFDISGAYLTFNSTIDLNYTTQSSNKGNFKQYTGEAKNNEKLKINIESNYGTISLKN